MSLLMDALRKAERQKQQGTEPPLARQDSPTEKFSLEELPERSEPVTSGHSGLPELPGRLEDLDDQFLTAASARSPRTTSNREAATGFARQSMAEAATREQARNIFTAKQAATSDRHSSALWAGGVALLLGSMIAGYFYWQLQPKGTLVPGPGLSVKPMAATATLPAPATAGQTTQALPSPPETPRQTPVVVAASPVTPTSPAPIPVPVPTTKSRASTAPDIPARSSPIQQTESKTPEPTPQAALRFRPGTGSNARDKSLDEAHDAFSRGEYGQAGKLWQDRLRFDPRDLDALHGLAAIAAREGNLELAASYHQQALSIDPKDAHAIAGLLASRGAADPRQVESRLKNLLAEQADSAPLHFALGNLYAADRRWAEAQQTFFQAHVADPGNPDYLYNLAVSLEHLHQPKLAVQYYRQALSAASTQSGGFNSARVEERVRALQASLAP